MSDFIEDAMRADEPDGRLSDLMANLKTNRTDLIAQLADYVREDGQPHRELMLSLTICQTCITALEQERDQW